MRHKISSILFIGFFLFLGINSLSAQTEMNTTLTPKGVLVPRMTTSQRNAIANPVIGFLVFDITTNSFWFYNGSNWGDLRGAQGPAGATGLKGDTGATGATGAQGPAGADGDSHWGLNSTKTFYNDGNVGIGTTDPSIKLSVEGGSDVNATDGGILLLGNLDGYNIGLDNNEIQARNNRNPSSLHFNLEGGNTTFNRDGGNLGIGTTSPQHKLHIKGNAGILNLEGSTHTFMQFYPDGYLAGRKAWFGFGSATSNTLTMANEFADGGLNFRTNGVNNRMYINKDGNIGIGTAGPAARLNIFSDSDVNASDGGFLILGSLTNQNIGIDNNEIQSRNNGQAASLYINLEGGDTQFNRDAGKVVIGNIPSSLRRGNYKLYVKDGILAERVRVALSSSSRWQDNAFGKYPSLTEMEAHIKEKSHLIGVPSAKELVETGIDVAEMDATLLRQIEWLWEYTIETDKEKQALAQKNKEQSQQITLLNKRLERLEQILLNDKEE